MAINSIVFSVNNAGIWFLIADFIVLTALFFLLKSKFNSTFTRNLFIWTNVLTTSFLMWSTASPHYILVVPVLISIASLTVNTKSFFIISSYCVLSLLTFGAMKIYNWGIPVSSPPFGYWQIIDGVIILGSAIYSAWQASIDLKYTLKGLKREIAKVSEINAEIKNLADFDPLTGLTTRSYCEQQYKEFFESTNSKNEQIAIFFLDLDNFKAINDNYNHTTGDKVLVEVSFRLKELAQTGGIASRLSGDEFVLIIRRPIHYNVQLFASRILQKVEMPVDTATNMFNITASIGIAIANKNDNTFDKIRKKANLAMHKAKQSGKNNYHLYSDKMRQESLNEVIIKNDLKKALKNGGLELYLQPKVDLSSNKTNSVEALLRWTGNNENNIGPAEFIPLIESTELICNIGEWVIKRSCQLCKELHNNGYTDMSIAVNISASQLKRGNLETIIKRELEESQLPARFLELELTEYTVFHDDGILNQLKQLKKLGVILSIDDFGTGYSNLEYLTKFNVDILKIDRSFIEGIPQSKGQYAIVLAIINMAKALGLKVVAEGIETNKQLSALKKLDCHYGQGYLWSKALPANDLLNYLDQENLNSTKPTLSQSHQPSMV